MAEENDHVPDARLTIRIDPDYLEGLAEAARELGTNQSTLVRTAVQEYVERHEKYFSPPLFRFFLNFRKDRKRINML